MKYSGGYHYRPQMRQHGFGNFGYPNHGGYPQQNQNHQQGFNCCHERRGYSFSQQAGHCGCKNCHSGSQAKNFHQSANTSETNQPRFYFNCSAPE